MSFDTFGNFSVPTEQQQPANGYTGLDTYYSHEASTAYTSSASLVLCNEGRTVRSTPGMASTPATHAGCSSYSDQQLPLSVYSDHTMTIDDHTLYNSAFMSSNAHLSLVSPGGYVEEHPNLACDSRNARRQRCHDADPHSAGSYQPDFSASVPSEGADTFLCGTQGNIGNLSGGIGHMVTGGDMDSCGADFGDVEFNQLMEQICSPDASDPLLPQCSPVMVFNEDANDVLRRVNVEHQPSGDDQIMQDLEAFQATDIQFQQSATIYGDFLKAPVQVHPAKTPVSEPLSQTLNSVESEPQSIEHDLEIMTLMRTTKKKNVPPKNLVLQNQVPAQLKCQEDNLVVATCTPAQVKMEFVSPTSGGPDFPSCPQTPHRAKTSYGVCSQPPMTPVQVSAPSPALPPTPMTPATPCPPSLNGPYELKAFSEAGKRCLTVSIRSDIADQGKRMAYQANVYSLELCRRFRECLDKRFDLNMALNSQAEMCDFEFHQATGQLSFSMPKECMHLDKWLAVHQSDGDLLDRQMVVQQVANFLAAIHGCGSEDKLCLWGSFVVWVAPDRQVYVMVDFPEMLCKMEREQMNAMYDPRVEDVKALYKLYNKVFEPFVKRGSSWISPGVKNLLQSFEQLLADPTSVYRMAELARMFGERRLCKLEVEIMTMMHTTYCIEHEKLTEVLAHFGDMLPTNCARWQVEWEVQWLESHRPVGPDVVAVAQRRMQLRFAPIEA